jgi:hypothetical protein
MDKQIFLSYSHRDVRWRDRLLTALSPWARRDEIDLWDDREIAAGEDWQERINVQIERSNIAVLLVSAPYLASNFIAEFELPRLVSAAERGKLTLAWIPVSASAWEVTALPRFQSAWDPHRPLNRMSRAKADEALVTVGRRIAGGRTLTDLSATMQIIDDAYDDVAEVAGVPARAAPFKVMAHHTGNTVEFAQAGVAQPIAVITVDDLAELPGDDHRLIQSLEISMRNGFERWTDLRPRRPILTTSERQAYEVAGRQMCEDLRHILDFIEDQLGKDLHDHYNSIRYACEKLVE